MHLRHDYNNTIVMRERSEDKIQLEHVQKRIKFITFDLMKNYFSELEAKTPLICYVLLTIESLQILWFSIHPQLSFLGTLFGLSQLRSVLSFLNFQHYIRANNALQVHFMILTFGLVAIQLVTVFLCIKWKPNQKEKAEKQKLAYFLQRIGMFQFLLLNTILIIPFFNVSVITLYCHADSDYYSQQAQCYQGIHAFLCALAVFVILVLLLQSLLFWFFFYTKNPLSKSFYALPNNLFRLAKLPLKLIPPIYFAIDSGSKMLNLYVFIFAALCGIYIFFFRVFSQHSYKEIYFYFEYFQELIILWVLISNILFFSLEEEMMGMSLLHECMCGLVFAWAVMSMEKMQSFYFFNKNMIKKLKKQEFQRFFIKEISLLISQENRNFKTIIKSISSTFENCDIKIYHTMTKSSHNPAQLQHEIIYFLLKHIENLSPEYLSNYIRYAKAEFLFSIGTKVLSFHVMSELANEKLTLYEEYLLYVFNEVKTIFKDDDKMGCGGSEIKEYLEYVELMNEMEAQIQLCAQGNYDYWEEFEEDEPSFPKICSLAFKSKKHGDRIECIFQEIEGIYPDNCASILLYSKYLNEVKAHHNENNHIKEKLIYIEEMRALKEKDELHDDVVRFRSNQELGVICISTSNNTLGNILSSNGQVKTFLNYDKEELIGQRVNKIMPKMYNDIHDSFITNYLVNIGEAELPSNKTVYSVHKSGRVIETSLAVKIFPSFKTGFQLVGFLKEKNKEIQKAQLILDMETMKVEGMTAGFIRLIQDEIKVEKIVRSQLDLTQFFPDLQANHLTLYRQNQVRLALTDCTDHLIVLDNDSKLPKKSSFNLTLVSQKKYDKLHVGVVSVSDPTEDLISISNLGDRDSENDSRMKETKITNALSFEGQENGTPIEKKIQDFVNSESNKRGLCFLRAFVIFIFVLSLSLIVFLNISMRKTFIEEIRILEKIPKALSVAIIEGQLLVYNHDFFDPEISTSEFQEVKSKYQESLMTLKENLLDLVKNLKSENQQILNIQLEKYLLEFQISENETKAEKMTYINAGLEGILFGESIIKNERNALTQPLPFSISHAKQFIENNFKKQFPDITIKISEKYTQIYSESLEDMVTMLTLFLLSKSLYFLISFAIIIYYLHRLQSFCHLIIEIYNSILKWDIFQLKMKCKSFMDSTTGKPIQPKDQPNEEEKRRSNLIQFIPKEKLFREVERIGKAKKKSSQRTEIMTRKQISHFNDKVKYNKELQKSKNSQEMSNDFIHLQKIKKSKGEIIVIILLFLVMVTGFIVIFYLNEQFTHKLDQNKNSLINTSKFSKSLIFGFYFGSKLVQGDASYRSLYDSEIQSYYDLSGKVHPIIGSPGMTLRTAYTYMELVNSLVEKRIPGISSEEERQYLRMSKQNIFQCLGQIRLKNEELEEQVKNEEKVLEKIDTISFIINDFVLLSVCFLFIEFFIVEKLRRRIEESISMINMLPSWIASKNKVIKDFIMDKDEEGLQEKRARNHDKNMSEEDIISNAEMLSI